MFRVKVSRLLNQYLLGDKPKRMLSSRVYVSHTTWAITLIDRIFFWQEAHCRDAFYYDLADGGYDG